MRLGMENHPTMVTFFSIGKLPRDTKRPSWLTNRLLDSEFSTSRSPNSSTLTEESSKLYIGFWSPWLTVTSFALPQMGCRTLPLQKEHGKGWTLLNQYPVLSGHQCESFCRTERISMRSINIVTVHRTNRATFSDTETMKEGRPNCPEDRWANEGCWWTGWWN